MATFLRNLVDQHASRLLENFQPSERFEKLIGRFDSIPTTSIESAVEPLVSVVPDVKEMVTKSKEKCSDPKEGLNVDESAAIMLYTLEWTPRENSFYIILNRTLRKEDQTLLKPWHSYLKLFVSALEKLPVVVETIYRGVKKNMADQYPKGKKFTWWSFTSCTKSVEVLQSDQFLGKTGPRTLFSIQCESGRCIQQHSYFPSEDEVLLLAGRKFEVTSSLDSGNELVIIQLKEIESDEPLLGTSKSQGSTTDRRTTDFPTMPKLPPLPELPKGFPPMPLGLPKFPRPSS